MNAMTPPKDRPLDRISVDWRRILKCLSEGPIAWRTPSEVARELGWDEDRTTDELASLDVAGWIQVWVRETDVVVILSPFGAEQLGLRLIEVGSNERLKWVPASELDRAPRRRQPSAVTADPLCLILDPSPSPHQLLEQREESLASPGAGDSRPPSRLIGLSLIPWPGPAQAPEGSCPACGSRRLRRDEYCLQCDRWGGDDRWTSSPARGSGTRRRSHRGPDEVEALWAASRKRHRARQRARMADRARQDRINERKTKARRLSKNNFESVPSRKVRVQEAIAHLVARDHPELL